MTVAPGAPRTTPGPHAPDHGAGSPVAQGMTAMIHRLLAGYAVLGLLPGLPELVAQAPLLPRAWVVAVCVVQAVVVGGMLVLAVLGRPLGPWLLAFAAFTLAAVVTLGPVGPSQPLLGPTPFLWFHVGLAVVCACVWGGLRFGVPYTVVLSVAWTVLRLQAGGGGADLEEALSEGLFAGSAGLVVAVVALAMLASARDADRIAAQLRETGLRQAVDRAVADERARLDQLIHDDVMTTLTAAAHSHDLETGRATALLARQTLSTIDALRDASEPGSTLSVSVLASLAEQTVHQVSPDVGYHQRIAADVGALRVPGAVAESLLSALREAVRNAVRHSGATTIDVELDATRTGEELALVTQVRDDGRGFEPDRLPGDRLGVRVSMLEATRLSGLRTELVSAPGQGTTFTLTWTGRPGVVRRVVPPPDESELRLPADFPTSRFTAMTWVALGVGVLVGLLMLEHYRALTPLLVAMVLAVVATALVLRPGAGLRLPVPVAAVVVALVAALCVAMDLTVPERALGLLVWHMFPVQLILVTLVVRRRLGWALLGLAVLEASVVWWCLTGEDGWPGVLSWGAGALLFVAMAVLVNRVLTDITRRQAALRHEEEAAIDASARRHAAVVQRVLWVADLRTQTRPILERVAASDGAVPPDLVADALLVEATLRESLVARNVMTDELADLTEAARRRGVDVRLVDSRHTSVPPPVGQALLDAVRRGLATESVSRLVVRLAPEDGSTSASILTEDAEGTHLVHLDASGATIPSEVETRAR